MVQWARTQTVIWFWRSPSAQIQANVWFVAQAECAMVSDRQATYQISMRSVVLLPKWHREAQHTAQFGSACSAASSSEPETNGTAAANSARATPRIALMLGDGNFSWLKRCDQVEVRRLGPETGDTGLELQRSAPLSISPRPSSGCTCACTVLVPEALSDLARRPEFEALS